MERVSIEPGTSGWLPIETAPKDGNFLVWLPKSIFGNHIFPMRVGSGINIIGSNFHFDMPKPTYWMPLPPPPKDSPPAP